MDLYIGGCGRLPQLSPGVQQHAAGGGLRGAPLLRHQPLHAAGLQLLQLLLLLQHVQWGP
jgi:hypothetical protein